MLEVFFELIRFYALSVVDKPRDREREREREKKKAEKDYPKEHENVNTRTTTTTPITKAQHRVIQYTVYSTVYRTRYVLISKMEHLSLVQ